MKFSQALELLLVNAILLLLLYFVTVDQAERAVYAAREGFSFFFSRSFLVLTSVLRGPRGDLQSPFTIDWVQLLLAALLIVDLVSAYGWLERRRKARPPAS